MAYEITQEQLDFKREAATISFVDSDINSHVNVHIQLPTPGDQAESDLRAQARKAAKAALEGALAAI